MRACLQRDEAPAAVAILRPLLAHHQTPRVEVEIAPSQPEQLTTTHPGPERQLVERVFPSRRNERQERPDLLDGPGQHLLALPDLRVAERPARRVAVEDPVLHRVVQGRPQAPMNVEDRLPAQYPPVRTLPRSSNDWYSDFTSCRSGPGAARSPDESLCVPGEVEFRLSRHRPGDVHVVPHLASPPGIPHALDLHVDSAVRARVPVHVDRAHRREQKTPAARSKRRTCSRSSRLPCSRTRTVVVRVLSSRPNDITQPP